MDLSRLRAGVDRLAGAVKRTDTTTPLMWGEWAVVEDPNLPSVVLESDWQQTPRPVRNAAGRIEQHQRVYVLHQGPITTIVANPRIIPPQPVAYAPIWSQSGGTVLSIGSGTLDATYQRLGSVVEVAWRLVRASDSNYGSNAYIFNLPFNAATGYNAVTGSGFVQRGSEFWPVAVVGVTTGLVGLVRTDTRARVSNSDPDSWAPGDVIQFRARYSI